VVKDGKSLSQPQVVSYGRFIIGFPAAEMDATSPLPLQVGGLTTTWSFDGRRKRAVEEEEAEPLMNPDAPWTHL